MTAETYTVRRKACRDRWRCESISRDWRFAFWIDTCGSFFQSARKSKEQQSKQIQ